MARPSATPAAAMATAAARVCLGVALAALLLAAASLSRRSTGVAAAAVPSCAGACAGARDRGDTVRSYHPRGGGYVDYLYIFCCVLGGERRPALGYAAMAAWLAVLFYLLADTAASYFCPSLERLARLLRLPPAIAGATLLSLGNGAPDALSALASFSSTAGGKGGAAAVGLGGVLGGAMFVSAAVLGVVALRVGGRGFAVDRASFFRDAGFLLLALAAVAVVLTAGEVTVWGAAAFASIYLVYVFAIAVTPERWARPRTDAEEDHGPSAAAAAAELHNVAETKFYTDQEAPLLEYYAGDNNNNGGAGAGGDMKSAFWNAMSFLALPLNLPRRLTIPDASKERWSKPAAVTSATLAPIFLSVLWTHRATGTGSPFPAAVLLLGGAAAGIALGILAYLTTDTSAPPTRFLAAWVGGGFAMSVAWAYVIAGEVLSLLVSAGAVMDADAAALGVTVLAWGNSLGDLIANVAVASRGGPGGAQVAVAGCYGGPVFNVLVGLGMSMLLSCWAGYPRPVKIPREPGLYRTLGFVVAGLVWALVMLPRRGMRVDRTLGFGLLAIYFCFICVSISQLKKER
ncbi:unnamed protein product [Urochloa decumbens]|uniref:Sodium/calcium exchanger membrane region domain-containing protein n=1 Tax=Urochloa decumbens TaxID=240449 RepID=A0ABC8YFZ3_9POAL